MYRSSRLVFAVFINRLAGEVSSSAGRLRAFPCAGMVLAMVLAGSGCSQKAAQAACTPGQASECSCPDGAKGAQSCQEDGKAFGPCECAAPGAAAAAAPGADTAAAPATETAAAPATEELAEEGEDGDVEAGEAYPSPVRPASGGTYWAAYVYAGDSTASAEAKAAAKLLAQEGGGKFADFMEEGGLDCDDGAAKALKLPDSAVRIGVYFKTSAEAKAFASAWPKKKVRTAKVKTYCRD
jgi:hypothetical protein